ncbi:unnamed protein product, partial [Iphiclides podalirius]
MRYLTNLLSGGKRSVHPRRGKGRGVGQAIGKGREAKEAVPRCLGNHWHLTSAGCSLCGGTVHVAGPASLRCCSTMIGVDALEYWVRINTEYT